jgi:glycosyltransferase involved in cell wall biosynthesis
MIEILEVALDRPVHPDLHGCNIESPQPGARTSGDRLNIVGWVVGRSEVVAVEVVHGSTVVARARPTIARPDVADAFPLAPGALYSGFRARIALMPTAAGYEISIRAVLPDQRRVSLGSLQVKRAWRDGDNEDAALVSVIIPCYGQAHFLGSAIESVIAQTYPHVEVVVVDDGSPDNASQVANRYAGVRVVRQANEGLAGARNRGIRESSGDYLVFLDADDRLAPEALGRGLESLRQNPEAAFVAGRSDVIDLDGCRIAEQPPVTDGSFEGMLRTAPIWNPAAVMYRRSVFDVVAPFDRSVAGAEDYDLYYRVASTYTVVFHDQVVALYRKHGWNMTEDPERMLRANMKALTRQKYRTRDGERTKAAYRQGMAYWRRVYGEPLTTQVLDDIRTGRWSSARRGLASLARYHPGALGTIARSAIFRQA